MRWRRGVLTIGIILVVLSSVIIGRNVISQAQSSPGLVRLDGAPVQALAADRTRPGTLYAGVAGPNPALWGVYRSNDGGQTWQALRQGVERPIYSLAISTSDGRILYAGSGGGPATEGENALFRSTDGGRSWTRLTIGLPADASGRLPIIRSLSLDPASPHILYVSTDTGLAYRVALQGYLVTAQPIGPARVAVYQIVPLPPDSHTLLAATAAGLYRSTNAGQAWLAVPTLRSMVLSIATTPTGSIAYAATAAGIARSSDGGQTWSLVSPFVAEALAVDAHNASVVYAAYGPSPTGIKVSTDGGHTWTELDPVGTAAPVTTLVTDPALPSSVYAATDGGSGVVAYASPVPTSVPRRSVPSLAGGPDPLLLSALVGCLLIVILVVVERRLPMRRA